MAKIKITIDPKNICSGEKKETDTPAYKVGEILQKFGQMLMESDGILPKELRMKDNDGNEIGTFLYK